MSEHIAEAGHHAGQAVEHAGTGVKGVLGKKLGPLPVGGWVLAVAGGVGVALYFRNRSAGNAANLPDITATDATGATDGFTPQDPGGTQQGVGNGGSYTYTDTANHGAGNGNASTHHGDAYLARHATTNAAWESHSIDAMHARGFGRPAVRESLDAYLAAHRLTAGQEVRLSATLAICGPPPHPPKHIAGPGTPKATSTPAGHATPPRTPPVHQPTKGRPTTHQDSPKPPRKPRRKKHPEEHLVQTRQPTIDPHKTRPGHLGIFGR